MTSHPFRLTAPDRLCWPSWQGGGALATILAEIHVLFGFCSRYRRHRATGIAAGLRDLPWMLSFETRAEREAKFLFRSIVHLSVAARSLLGSLARLRLLIVVNVGQRLLFTKPLAE